MKQNLLYTILVCSKYFVFITCLQLITLQVLSAMDIKAQTIASVREIKIDVDLNNATIKEAFDMMENRTNLKFSYDARILKSKHRITFQKKAFVVELLENISRTGKLHFKQINENIHVKRQEPKANPNSVIEIVINEKVIKGTVTSENGDGLPGVNVLVKGTTIGTATDVNGEYSLSVPDDATTIVFSIIGYTKQEIEIGAQSIIDVQLIADVKALQEVVVIGYGTQEKKEITSAVSSVKVDEAIKVPINRIDQALQGRAAGVQVINNSGRPGAGVTMRIRGTSTTGNNNPLFVVDGVQTENIQNINPNDIESIDVLKDAGAAIYGAQAANGVVIITTKKGVRGTPQINFETSFGFQEITKDVPMMNKEQYVRLYSTAEDNDGIPEDASERWWTLDDLNIPHDTDWLSELYRDKAAVSNTNVSVSGGNEKTSYYVGLNYFDQQGIMRSSEYDKFNLRLNTDTKIGEKITFGNTLTVGQERWSSPGGPPDRNELLITALRANPTIPLFWTQWDVDNNPRLSGIQHGEIGDYAGPTRNGDHPGSKNVKGFIEEERFDYKRNRIRGLGTLYGEYKILGNLKFRTQFSGDYTINKNNEFERNYAYGTKTFNNSFLQVSDVNTLFWSWDNTLNYNLELNGHNFDLLAGVSSRRQREELLSIRQKGFINQDLSVINAGAETDKANGNVVQDSWVSYLGRLNYDYQGKYLVQLIFRADGSSKFGPANRFGYFPSVSVGWRISEEGFFGDGGPISQLKLRASWGQTGNDRISRFAFAQSLTLGATVFNGDADAPINFTQRPGNPNLKWETVTQTNVGVDVSLLGDAISFSADYYVKETTDLLVTAPVPSSSGFDRAPFVNDGDIRNTGFEFDVSYRNIKNLFKWNISANISAQKNELIKLGSENADRIRNGRGATAIDRVGEPLGSFFGLRTDGLFQSIEEVNAYTKDGNLIQPNAQPGDIRFVDFNDDGVINNEDRQIIGNAFPDFTYGLTFAGEYKAFDFSLFFQGVQGNDIWRGDWGFEDAARRENSYAWTANYWTPENRHNDVRLPRPTRRNENQNRRGSDRWISDGSYLRIKNLQIGYTLPNDLSQKIGLQRFRAYLSAINLITFTDFEGNDPEIGVGENFTGIIGASAGVQYPQTRTVVLGIQISL